MSKPDSSNRGTLVIDNFRGSMTSYHFGDINSGRSDVIQSSGQDPFTKPGTLTWNESAVQIDPTGSVVTDCIMAGKSRLESGIVYVYAVGHTGRLYKIQVNDPTTYNPNYDNPVLLATLSINTPTFKRGGFLEFFGATEQIYIGHDEGLTSIAFNGTGEAFVGTQGSWTQDVPRPLRQFLGNLYVGNGNNIAELGGASGIINTYTKLSPGFPTNTQVRDLDITPDGNYVQAVVTEATLNDITLVTPNTSLLAPSNSFIFRWNGTDAGYTAYTLYPAVVLSANAIFGSSQYAFGFDYLGGGIYNPTDKWITSTTNSAFTESPLPNGVLSFGNQIAWASPLVYNGFMGVILNTFGTPSEFEIAKGFYTPLFQYAKSPETDINRIPCLIPISNFAQGTSFSGYTGNNIGAAKLYVSTIESSSAPTTKYRLYKWTPAPTGLNPSQSNGIYQTQTQMFSKKVSVSEVRVYGEPWVAGVTFSVDLIGSDGNPITNGSMTFTAGSNLTIGEDYAWYGPDMKPSYCLGIRVSQLGTTNFTINKIEIDYGQAGK